MEQTRRGFLRTCSVLGAAGVAAVVTGSGCAYLGLAKKIGATCSFTVNEQGQVVVDLLAADPLKADHSSAFLKDTPLGRPIIVTHVSDQVYHALDSKCTHRGCTVNATTPTLNCPCHGSRYTLTGEVEHGPTTKPLRELPSVRNGNLLIITDIVAGAGA